MERVIICFPYSVRVTPAEPLFKPLKAKYGAMVKKRTPSGPKSRTPNLGWAPKFTF